MRLTVSSARSDINWNARYDERLAQDVANLIRCYMGDVPYYRSMGVDGSYVHQPLPEANDDVQTQIEEMLDEYAEGITVDEVRVFVDLKSNETVIEVGLSDADEEDAEE